MKQLETNIVILTPPAVVWSVLTDFESFPQWNPFVTRIQGEPRVDSHLSITVKPPSKKAMDFTPKVLVSEPSKELRWLGSGPIKGLFDGEHYFLLTEVENGTLFTHGEVFRGILVPFFGSILRDTEVGFEAMNRALKSRAEEVR